MGSKSIKTSFCRTSNNCQEQSQNIGSSSVGNYTKHKYITIKNGKETVDTNVSSFWSMINHYFKYSLEIEEVEIQCYPKVGMEFHWLFEAKFLKGQVLRMGNGMDGPSINFVNEISELKAPRNEKFTVKYFFQKKFCFPKITYHF